MSKLSGIEIIVALVAILAWWQLARALCDRWGWRGFWGFRAALLIILVCFGTVFSLIGVVLSALGFVGW